MPANDSEPNYLFDRDAIYFLRDSGWTGDYWSEKRWIRVPYPAGQDGVDSIAQRR